MTPDSTPAPSPTYHPLGRRAQRMFQVTFSDQSMSELNKLPVEEQLKVVDRISNITSEQLAEPSEAMSRFHRGKKIFYRVRVGDLRCYFEIKGEILFSHYILHKNSLTDFIYRNKLPVTEETMAEQHGSFWKYLESFKK
jgi:mRNA-degrading endonuclease RelE of RelBE toxin-antitoxin system